MAVKLGTGSHPARGYAARRKFAPMSDINVTPMVDVMLVLLVIFMVTAPLLTVGIPVDLPKTKAQSMSDSDEPVVVSVAKDGKIYIQETPIEIDALGPRVAAITQNKPDTKIFIRGDKGVDYGRVMTVMGELTAAGFSKVALIVETPGATAPNGANPNGAKPDAKQPAN